MRTTSLFILSLQAAALLNGPIACAWTSDIHEIITKQCLDGYSQEFVERAVRACVDVDTVFNPLTNFNPQTQMWHFNINECKGGTKGDSRFKVAIRCLEAATKKPHNAATYLGMGLHAIQDVFAHTDAFVRKHAFYDGTQFYGHIEFKRQRDIYSGIDIDSKASSLADSQWFIDENCLSFRSEVEDDLIQDRNKRYYRNQRYSDALTASQIYIATYKLLTSDAIKMLCDEALKDTAIARLKASTKPFDDAAIFARGTFAIYSLIDLLNDAATSILLINQNATNEYNAANTLFKPFRDITFRQQGLKRHIKVNILSGKAPKYAAPYEYAPIPINHYTQTATTAGKVKTVADKIRSWISRLVTSFFRKN